MKEPYLLYGVFDESNFLDHMIDRFPELDSDFILKIVRNVISYGLKNCNKSKDQFCYWLSDILPEVQFGEVAAFVELSYLTEEGRKMSHDWLKQEDI